MYVPFYTNIKGMMIKKNNIFERIINLFHYDEVCVCLKMCTYLINTQVICGNHSRTLYIT